MKLSLKLGVFVSFVAISLGSIGCATKQIAAITPVDGQARDKLVEKFETKEAVEVSKVASPEKTPEPLPPPVEIKSKNKKTKNGKKLAAISAGDPAVTPTPSPSPASGFSFPVPNRRPKKSPFWVGELQVLDITYLGMVAGQFELELKPMKMIEGRKVYHFEGRAKSSAIFNMIYSLNDKIESFVDYEGIFSHKFHMLLDQTRQKRDSLELYDHEKKQAYYWNRKNHITKGYSEIKEFQPIERFTQDSYSAYEYLRTLPLETGKEYSIPVVSEGKAWEAVATVLRREVVSTPIGRFPAIVVKPQTRFQGVLKQGDGDSFIWLSDDDRRFILQIEAKVKIGSVIGVIKKIVPGEKPAEEE